MASPNYSLPTISDNSPIDIVKDMNALANATDTAIKSVEEKIPASADLVKGTTYGDLKTYGFYHPTAPIKK